MKADNKKTHHSGPKGVELPLASNSSGCGPGCDCGTPSSGNKTIKGIITMVVLVAAGAILFFKATGVSQPTSGTPANEFPTALSQTGAAGAGQQNEFGRPLSAIAELNTVGLDLDTVFVLVPTKDNGPAMKETGAALASVEKTLHAKAIKTGTFVLQPTSPDYADMAAQMTPPGIMVLTKGKGLGIVSNGINESNLMQAYVASTSGGGCGTGCGPKGCPTTPPPEKKN